MKRRIILLYLAALCLFSGCAAKTESVDVKREPAPISQTAEPKKAEFDPMDIRTKEVDSTAFSKVGYDHEERVLLVCFRESGVYYCYYDVPRGVWDEFIAAESLGRYYNQEIKGQYEYKRLN